MKNKFLFLQPLRIVGFYGDGYLQHVSYTLRKINSTMSFSFRTMQENAVLLLSTFEGQEERMPPIRHMNDDSIVSKIISLFFYMKNFLHRN